MLKPPPEPPARGAGQSAPRDKGAGRNIRPRVPEYLSKAYWWAYLHPRSVRFFDNYWAVNTILWGNFARLRDSALDELGSVINGRVLQIACVYGDITPKLAQRLAPDAHLDVIDVAPIQLDNLQRKLNKLDKVCGDDIAGDICKEQKNKVALHCQDASCLLFDDNSFDQVMIFFLLHELPNDVKKRAVVEALRVLKPGGKLVIVDYHKPGFWHPHRYIMSLVFKTLEPFASDLWNHKISDYIPPEFSNARISKTTLFGGLYQKVVVRL